VTLFLLTVGLGYSSALVQMHFQHTRGDGSPMPGVNDVVEIFAGKRWVTRDEAEKNRPVSKLEKLITGPVEGVPFNGVGSMAPAFFQKDQSQDDDTNYKHLVKDATPEKKAEIDAQREGERAALQLWLMLPDAKRRAAYEADKFVPPAGKAPKAVTGDFLHNKAATGDGVKVKSILDARCATCHAKDGDVCAAPLEEYAHFVKYMEVPTAVVIPDGAAGAWCESERQIGKEKLAQSTHAHLLSFAMLFSLTGLVFAFSSYPGVVRGTLGPVVLLAQVADVSCWWLARLPDVGPYFAMSIMATGAVVGLGLALQILLSVFNMYGPLGKGVLLALFLGAGAGGGLMYVSVVKPHLETQKARKEQLDREAKEKAADAAKGGVKATQPPAAPPTRGPNGNGRVTPAPKAPNENGKVEPVPPNPMSPPSRLEKLLAGTFDPDPKKKGKWGGKAEGGMVRAFFDKDEDVFLPAMEDKSPELARLVDERRGEQALVLAWVKTAPDARKKAYEDDRFPLPAELKDKPFTAGFKADDAVVKVKSLLDARCAKCHGSGGDKEDKPLTKYEEFETYLKSEPPAVKE
jgi:mono/diheme cytochrome c family protein